ncbi:peptidylprolyl isomerase [Candidatus Kapabacteria bacterium]|nr:peptidylprolyl isomerase [Candidatus Kapabacteria bacterium]
MIKFLSAIILFSLATFSDEIVAEVGNEKITFSQLEKAYEKNLQNDAKRFRELSLDSALSFINLYTDYRLKVQDAIDKGYLKDSSIQSEIESNRRLLAESFYFENELMNPKINEIISRRKSEYKFAFIIIPFDNAEEGHKIEKRQKAQKALDSINSGMSFSDAAMKFSEDGKTAQEGGVVNNWVTGGSIQKPLEDVFFNLKPGEINTEVIETSYGCFIVKLLERKPRKLIDASHILLGQMSQMSNKSDSLKFIKQADSVLALINNGEDFERLARELSKDNTTNENGGRFGKLYSRSTGFLGTGAPLEPSISEKLYTMKKGDVPKIVVTYMGVHILKVNVVKEIDKDSEYEAAKEVYKKVFYKKDKITFMDSVAKKFGFKLNPKVVEQFQMELDTNKTTIGENWADNVKTSTKSLELFKFNGKSYNLGTFIKECINRKELRGYSLNDEGINLASRKIIDNELFNLATTNLESKYPNYKLLLNEFRDGIILFKAEDEEVWSKRKFDEQIAKTYWDSTKNNYMTNYKFDVCEIFRLNEASMKEIQKEVNSGSADFETIAEMKTQREGFREKSGKLGWIEKNKDETANIIPIDEAKKGKIIGPYKNKYGLSLIKIYDIEKPRLMTFEEAKPFITPNVQDIVQANLRDKWLKRVRTNHPVKIYDKSIKNILNK